MPNFQYNALDRDSRAATGTLDAPTRKLAIQTLARSGLFVTQIGEAEKTPESKAARPKTIRAATAAGGRRISLRSRASVLRQLATAMDAGLPLLTGLRIVQQQAESRAVADLMADLAASVQGGDSLSDAMKRHPRTFSRLHVSMVRAGETAGALEQVLGSLADFADRDLEIREKIRSAATYPAIVLVLATISVAVILTFILPRILTAVTDNAAILPLPTRILLSTSDVLQAWGWLILLLLIGGAWAMRQWLATSAGRLAFDKLKLATPVLGQTLRKIAVARFARTLGTLNRSGIQILESLDVLRDTLGNEALGQKIDQTRAAVTQGASIAEPLKETGEFPPMFIQVIALGERTGRLDEMLLRAADAYDRETTGAIQRVMTLLPTLFIVVLALLVAFILAAVLLPIVNMQASLPGM